MEPNQTTSTPITATRKQSIATADEGIAGLSITNRSALDSDQTSPTPSQNERDSDAEFMQEVMTAIHAHYGETSIRAKFQDYVLRFVRLAAVYEEEVYGQTNIGWKLQEANLGCGPVFADEATKKKELKANANRIEGWRQTIAYRYYEQDRNLWLQNTCIKNLDIYRQISKFKKLRHIPDQEISDIYDAFLKSIVTHRQMIEVRLIHASSFFF